MEENAIFAEEPVIAVDPAERARELMPWVAQRAKVFGKWMWIYFWIQIFALIPGAIGAVEESFETRTMIGTVLRWCGTGAMVFVFYRLGTVQDRIRMSAGLNLISLAATVILELLKLEVLSTLWTIPGAIIGVAATYQYMMGFSEALVTVDNEMAGKWEKLWKWFLWLRVGGIIGNPVLAILASVLHNPIVSVIFAIVVFVWALAVVGLSVVEIVYVYSTAKIFRRIAANL